MALDVLVGNNACEAKVQTHEIVQRGEIVDLDFETVLDCWNWKEINNCPGRYVIRKNDGKIAIQLTPQKFIQETCSRLKMNASLIDQSNAKNTIILLSNAVGLKNDKIFVIFFKDLGGIMTYEKQIMDKSGKVECLTYVHTLNNQSGMKRKLDSLNVFFKLSVTQTKSSHSQSQQHENHDNKVVGVDVIEKVVTDAKIN